MITSCENCWSTYDTEREGGNDFYCPKCSKFNIGGENGN